jgi:phospholipid transport system substrate-binding protein
MTLKNVLLCFIVVFHYTFIDFAIAVPTPTEQVKATVDAVLEVLRDKALDQETRRSLIRKHVSARFDYREMSKRTLAKYWKKATDGQQDRFVDLFSQLLQWSYIGRIEAYSDETVKYQKETIKKNRAQVETFIETGGTDIPIDYRLVMRGDEWFVYDVIIEQVSLIRNYRSSYQSIIKNEGMDGLLAKMETKVQELKEKKSD